MGQWHGEAPFFLCVTHVTHEPMMIQSNKDHVEQHKHGCSSSVCRKMCLDLICWMHLDHGAMMDSHRVRIIGDVSPKGTIVLQISEQTETAAEVAEAIGVIRLE